MLSCKNQATTRSFIPYSDIAEVGLGGGEEGGWIQTAAPKTQSGAQPYTSIPFAILAGTAKKKNCNDSGQYGLR